MRLRIALACIAFASLDCAAQRQDAARRDDALGAVAAPESTAPVPEIETVEEPPPPPWPWAHLDPRVPVVVRGWMTPENDDGRLEFVEVRYDLDEEGGLRVVNSSRPSSEDSEDSEDTDAGSAQAGSDEALTAEASQDAAADEASVRSEPQLFLAHAGSEHWTLSILDSWREPLRCTPDGGLFVCGDVVVTVKDMSPPLPIDEEAWGRWNDVAEQIRVDEPFFLGCCESGLDAKEEQQALKQARALRQSGDIGALVSFIQDLPFLRLGGWRDMRRQAIKAGHHELVIALFERTGLSMGSCSQDYTPVYELRQYAEACLEVGRRNCFLNLMIRVLGNHVSRVAYSSLAHAIFESDSPRLRKAEIDLAQFLMGLLHQFNASPGRQGELDSRSIAKAIDAANLKEQLIPELTRLAEREELDEHNRHRALMVLYFLQVPPEPTRQSDWNVAAIRRQHEARKTHLEQRISLAESLSALRLGILGAHETSELRLNLQAELESLPTSLERSLQAYRDYQRRQRQDAVRRYGWLQSMNAARWKGSMRAAGYGAKGVPPMCGDIKKYQLWKGLPADLAAEIRKTCER